METRGCVEVNKCNTCFYFAIKKGFSGEIVLLRAKKRNKEKSVGRSIQMECQRLDEFALEFKMKVSPAKSNVSDRLL
jgi:hypothetical protein